MPDEDPADVFAFPDFGQLAQTPDSAPGPHDQFFHAHLEASNSPSNGPIKVGSAKAAGDGFFRLPDSLDELDVCGPENENDGHALMQEPLHDTSLSELDVLADLLCDNVPWQASAAEFKTWDGFEKSTAAPNTSLFITEAGAAAYDAALTSTEDPLGLKNTAHSVVQTNPYAAGLLALVLGRGSVFFSWDDRKGCFTPNLDKMRILGHSTEVLRGLQACCLESGSATRFLSTYVRLTYRTHPSAVRVALAKSVDVLLLAVQRQFGYRGRRTRSLLQLQALVKPVHTILTYFKALVTKSSRCRTDEKILSLVFEEARALDDGSTLLSSLMRDVLSRASEPWTDFAEKWIGVKPEEGIQLTKDGPGKSFVKVENIALTDDFGFETEEPDYVLDENRMPSFIAGETATTMFEAGRNLRLLRTHHPDHPLCDTALVLSSNPPCFKWRFDWESMSQLQEAAVSYERHLFGKIRDWVPGTNSILTQYARGTMQNSEADGRLQFFGHDSAQLEGRFLASIELLNQPPFAVFEQNSLSNLVETGLCRQTNDLQQSNAEFAPHWSLIPLHSFNPLVAAQARIINREYMRLLFRDHGLREHIRVQKEFQLLGSGLFCSRLSHALFDPDLDTAERQAGVAMTGGVMGLRLNGRESWPPASSELRLALMGVLNESYLPEPASEPPRPVKEAQALPGDLSFAVRDLSPEEIDKCLDPSSLEALDFLRLSYKAPAPLSPIISTAILVKYDKIFRLLLRILRMLYVVGQLYRDTSKGMNQGLEVTDTWLRFRFEAQHFVTSISTYFFDTGIEIPWKHFETMLDGEESRVHADTPDYIDAHVLSPDGVREVHEQTLDHIMSVLLLRKRQQPVLYLLEEIFALILRFSHQVQLEVAGKVEGGATSSLIRRIYETFKKKLDIFITVCRGLGEKGEGMGNRPARREMAMGGSKRDEGRGKENTIERLLMMLEMSGYYSRPRR
ncbi:hypothetical protein GGR56DRAFT_632916 [Xylariaceae sp. FL0804]|nr:hypothetical protein GGR56DRAFT_632916 [Xylariaceae sp. FL0804]